MMAIMLALLLLLPSGIASAANAIDFLSWLHNRHSINAVNFDGNTCLEIDNVWNPPANSRWLFMNWAEAPEPANQATTIVFYAAKNSSPPITDSVTVYESLNPYTGNADLVVDILASSVNYVFATTTAPIPKNGTPHTVFVSLDTVDGVGDVFVVETGTGNFEFESMPTVPTNPVMVNWPIMNTYAVGCQPGGDRLDWAKIPVFGEFYVDLGVYHWLLPQAAADFVSQQGYSLGLSTSEASHDCALPTSATAIPQMCHTGNANFFPNGPEGAHGLFAYQLVTMTGALTTAARDTCLRRGIGDGCLVP